MIKLVEKQEELTDLLALCEKSAFGCKIGSLARAYGLDKGFSCFWMDEETQAVFALSDGLMVISGTIGDPAETADFVRAVGAGSVMCALRTAEALGLHIAQTGDVLKKTLPQGDAVPAPPAEVNIRELYGLLNDTGMVEEFEPFYLDLSHRLRHGEAMVHTRRSGEELSGCVVVSAIGQQAAILSAVAVREEDRRQGVGSGLVKAAEAFLAGKTVYIFREKGAHSAFYKGLGYDWCDAWTYCKL